MPVQINGVVHVVDERESDHELGILRCGILYTLDHVVDHGALASYKGGVKIRAPITCIACLGRKC